MAEAVELGTLRKLPWQRIFLFTAATLASTILLKVGGVQYLELVYLGLIFVLLLLFVENGYQAVTFRLLLWLALGYALFCCAALVLGLASLRFNFYFPAYLPPLKEPVWITISRIVELIASVFGMLYTAQVFAQDTRKLKFTMKVYFWTGVASAIFAFISVPFSMVGIYLGGEYDFNHRLKGFYNEGGPYGLYLVSVAVVGITLDRFGWMPRRQVRWLLVLVCVALPFSYSKAAIMAVITLFALNFLLARNLTTRLASIGVGLVIFFAVIQFIDLPRILLLYEQASAQYERLSHLRPEDASFVYGRIAGAFIVPRMIAEHPLTGIGWGNYGLLRNAPEYRSAAYFTEFGDDPGLGLYGTAAEIGLPLVFYLVLLLLVPFLYLSRLRVPNRVANLALVQVVVHVYGAQLNTTYPWVVSAFALGVGIYTSRNGHLPGPEPEIATS